MEGWENLRLAEAGFISNLYSNKVQEGRKKSETCRQRAVLNLYYNNILDSEDVLAIYFILF